MSTRLRNVLVLLVALFVLGASSQAAVCELACGPEVAVAKCSAAGHSEAMVMSHGHCSHGMGIASMHRPVESVGGFAAGSCGHALVPVFAKGGSGVVQFSAVQWVLVGVVPVDVTLTGRAVGVGGRPPLVGVGVDPLVLRV